VLYGDDPKHKQRLFTAVDGVVDKEKNHRLMNSGLRNGVHRLTIPISAAALNAVRRGWSATALDVPRRCAGTVAHGAIGREALDLPARWRAAPGSSPTGPARLSTASRLMPPTCRALDVPCRCARTDASGAIGREALDAATVASGAKIKPGERSTASRSMLGGVPRAGIKPGEAVPPRQNQCRGMIGREALDAGMVASSAGKRSAEASPSI
jgi:hypothetical protein